MQFSNPQRETFQTVHNTSRNASVPSIVWSAAQSHPDYYPIIFQGDDVEDRSENANVHDTTSRLNQKNPFLTQPLIPNRLNNGQLQWLLENQWAQEAFLSSFSLALIDNAQTFQHVRKLNIARLSSKYLPELKREDIWSALPNLEKLTLFVSPDWRNIIKENTGVVIDEGLYPSKATAYFYDLLDACIKDRMNLIHLDLGWTDGGERASGIFARNQHIIPAPLLNLGRDSEPRGSVNLRCDHLILPYVKNLRLRNCWFTPDALKQLVQDMQNESLEILTLDSVSLTAVPRETSEEGDDFRQRYGNARVPDAVIQHVIQMHNQANGIGPANGVGAVNAAIGAAIQNYRLNLPLHQAPYPNIVTGIAPPGGHLSYRNTSPDLPPTSSSLENDLREGSWPEVIDRLTPGATIDEKRFLHNFIEDRPEPRDSGSLRRVEFISCGYLRLRNMRYFDQEVLPKLMTSLPQCLVQRYYDLSVVMMSSGYDKLLGQIVPLMAKHESDTLQYAFGMQMGWDSNDMSRYENREDGQPIGGSGRFSGAVEKRLDCTDHLSAIQELNIGMPVNHGFRLDP